MEPEVRFLAAVSHEIRNPMTSILGLTEILLHEELAPENHETLESCREALNHCKDKIKIIRSNAEFILTLLNDILDFSKLEVKKLHVAQKTLPLRPFLNELTAPFAILATEKNLVFSVEAKTPLPETIFTDPLRLWQILANLIGNALKYTLRGEIVVSVSWCPADNHLLFAVRDTGIGIPQEKLPSLFFPFYQANNPTVSTAQNFAGSGLGLTISKLLIQLLGGSITVESCEGQGSTFTVIHPQQLPDNVRFVPPNEPITVGASASISKPGNQYPLAGRKILLVEDSPDTQRLFAFILKKAGAEVSTADNGQTALEKALESMKTGAAFDLILMDADLPIMDGYTVTRLLRESGYEKPIVALTASALPEDRQKFHAAGCTGYITKPIPRAAFIAAVLGIATSGLPPLKSDLD